MGYFTNNSYKYWKRVEQENKRICDIKMIEEDIEKIEEDLELLKEIVIEYDNEIKVLIDKKENEDDTTKKSDIEKDIIKTQNLRKAAFDKGKKGEETIYLNKRYGNITFRLQRLKDIDTREEALSIQILDGQNGDGIIITSISKIDVDINKLEKYGILFSAVKLDELVKIIMDNYFNIEIEERDFIGSEIRQEVIEEFVYFCYQKMKSKLNSILSKEKDYYDLKTTDLSKYHKESRFVNKYALKDIKAAMFIYGYLGKPDRGRGDNNVNNQRVVRFHRAVIDELKKQEEKNEQGTVK